MRYITLEDIKSKVKSNVINDVVENNLTYLDTAEKVALDQVEAYIGHRYDVNAEYNITGEQRNYYLMKIVMDIIIYDLFSRLSPGQIPQLQVVRYDNSIKYLEDVSSGKVSANLPLRINEIDGSSHVGGIYGSSDPRVTSNY